VQSRCCNLWQETEELQISYFIICFDTSGVTSASDGSNILFADPDLKDPTLLERAWSFQYEGSTESLLSDKLSTVNPNIDFRLAECTVVLQHDHNATKQNFRNLGDAAGKSLTQSAQREQSGTESPSSPDTRSASSPFLKHLVALEEELADMGSRYGFSERARNLLMDSPFR
jgi:hypothetical protein